MKSLTGRDQPKQLRWRTMEVSVSARLALSERQLQCLELVAEGLTSAGIGRELGLSPRTVDEHLNQACKALGVRTRVQAVARLVIDEAAQADPAPP